MPGTIAAKLIWEKTGNKGIEGMVLRQGRRRRPGVVTTPSAWKSERCWVKRGFFAIRLRITQEKVTRYRLSTDTRCEAKAATSLDCKALAFPLTLYSPLGQRYHCQRAGNDLSSQSLRNCRFSVEGRGRGGVIQLCLSRPASTSPTHFPLVGHHWITHTLQDESRKRKMMRGEKIHDSCSKETHSSSPSTGHWACAHARGKELP